MYKLPESPYWLIQKGHLGQAKQSLQFYRGANYDISSEFNEIRKKEQEKIEMSYQSKTFMLSRFCSKSFWKPFSCIGALYFLHVFDGFTPVIVYLSGWVGRRKAILIALLATSSAVRFISVKTFAAANA